MCGVCAFGRGTFNIYYLLPVRSFYSVEFNNNNNNNDITKTHTQACATATPTIETNCWPLTMRWVRKSPQQDKKSKSDFCILNAETKRCLGELNPFKRATGKKIQRGKLSHAEQVWQALVIHMHVMRDSLIDLIIASVHSSVVNVILTAGVLVGVVYVDQIISGTCTLTEHVCVSDTWIICKSWWLLYWHAHWVWLLSMTQCQTRYKINTWFGFFS